MKASIFVGARAFAVLDTGTVCLNIRLEPGYTPSYSLRGHAAELRATAARLLRNADIAEQGAGALAEMGKVRI